MSEQIKTIAHKYRQYTLWMIVAMSMVILLACRVSAQCDSILPKMINPLAVSVIFSLVSTIAYGQSWQAVAKSSPVSLTKFYLAASALKMMLAAVVFLVYALVADRSTLLGFTVIFVLFYIVLLIFDCIYFAKVERKMRIS